MASSSSDPVLNQRSWRLRKFFSVLAPKSDSHPTPMEEIGVVQNDNYALIYGGATSLGAKCVADLKMKGWWVASVDFAANNHADANIILFIQENVANHEEFIMNSIKRTLNSKKLNLIYCTPDTFLDGGVEDSLVKVGITMWHAHMVPAMISAKLATVFLSSNGILILTGSLLAMTPNTDMIAYSTVKSSVVHLTKCLAIPGSGMPSDARVFCLLPRYLDTVAAKCLYKHVHPDSFTPLDVISDLILSWTKRENLPVTGTVFKIVTDDCVTSICEKSW